MYYIEVHLYICSDAQVRSTPLLALRRRSLHDDAWFWKEPFVLPPTSSAITNNNWLQLHSVLMSFQNQAANDGGEQAKG